MGAEPLSPREVVPLLRAMPEVLRLELEAWPSAVADWHPAAGEWCVKEVLGHLIEAEKRGFAGRVRSILQHVEPALVAWDQTLVAGERRDCEQSAGDLLREFGALRRASVELVRHLGDADLARGGEHPQVGRLRVSDLLHEWIHHDRNHLRQILANVQAYSWPHMGNAQRFSAD